MKRDGKRGDRLDRLFDLGDLFEGFVTYSLIGGLLVGGIAALLGLSPIPAIVVGAGVSAITLILLAIRARRRGTTILGDD